MSHRFERQRGLWGLLLAVAVGGVLGAAGCGSSGSAGGASGGTGAGGRGGANVGGRVGGGGGAAGSAGAAGSSGGGGSAGHDGGAGGDGRAGSAGHGASAGGGAAGSSLGGAAGGAAGTSGIGGGAGGASAGGAGGGLGSAGAGGRSAPGTGGVASTGGSAGSTGGGGGSAGARGSGGAGGGASLCGPALLACHYGNQVTCRPGTFTFESGTTDGFVVEPLFSLGDPTIASSSARAHTGTHSLVWSTSSANGVKLFADVPLCGLGEYAVLEGSTLSMWIYIETTMTFPYPQSTYSQISLQAGTTNIPSHRHMPALGFALGEWVHLTEYIEVTPLGETPFANMATGFSFTFGIPGPPGWMGNIYFDDITITPAM